MNQIQRYLSHLLLTIFVGLSATLTVSAQWTNHYQKLDDFGHHVYLEQHELPILSHGTVDPAPGPDGKTLAFAAQGWIWLMDLDTGVANRLTNDSGIDSRPRWSPDGTHITFVRDTGNNTSIVIREIKSGEEQIIDTPAIELDPEFSNDGNHLFILPEKVAVSNSVDIILKLLSKIHSQI